MVKFCINFCELEAENLQKTDFPDRSISDSCHTNQQFFAFLDIFLVQKMAQVTSYNARHYWLQSKKAHFLGKRLTQARSKNKLGTINSSLYHGCILFESKKDMVQQKVHDAKMNTLSGDAD